LFYAISQLYRSKTSALLDLKLNPLAAPTARFISPIQFIPMAEETGLINAVGYGH
jgi:hypothetical protein